MCKNSIYDNKLIQKNIRYKRIGTYTTQAEAIEHECLDCGTRVFKEPKKVLAGVGCKSCAIKKLTWSSSEYDDKIKSSTFIRISEYINNLTEILHRCKKCNSEYVIRPASILRGHGCKYCNNRVAKTTQYYTEELSNTVECLDEYINNKTPILHKCTICNNTWYANPNNILSKESGCPICAKLAQSSKAENELVSFIKENYSGWIIKNDRTLLDGKELDVVLPDIGLAFEYNGIYWHSEKFISRNYHLNKSIKVEELGYKLIHIFEDTWETRKDIIKSRILSLLGKSKKIYAKHCTIEELSECREFLDTNHLQGYCTSSINIGLFNNGELVAAMTFGTPRFNNTYKYELIRYCSKLGYTVVGGASKLLKYFRDKYPGSIISYGNRMWGIPSIYKILGFRFIGFSEPNYRYYKGIHSLSRYQCQKHKLVSEGYDSNKTESEIMKERGYLRVYDCGNSIWDITNIDI